MLFCKNFTETRVDKNTQQNRLKANWRNILIIKNISKAGNPIKNWGLSEFFLDTMLQKKVEGHLQSCQTYSFGMPFAEDCWGNTHVLYGKHDMPSEKSLQFLMLWFLHLQGILPIHFPLKSVRLLYMLSSQYGDHQEEEQTCLLHIH